MKKTCINAVSIAGLFLAGLFTSCSEDSMQGDLSGDEAITLNSTAEDIEINQVTDVSSDIIEEAYRGQEYPTPKSAEADQYLPSCVTISAEVQSTLKTVTIDFGDGCTLRNGNFVSGKIIVTYQKDVEAASKRIDYEYSAFQFNAKKIEGSGSILRERANAQGNPQATKNFDITVTWPNDKYARGSGLRIREMIGGQNTLAWGDNVFLISGSWEFTRRNGSAIAVSITDALRREMACKYLVSGVVAFKKGENTGRLDYGNGDCDDLATLTINDREPTEIHIGQ